MEFNICHKNYLYRIYRDLLAKFIVSITAKYIVKIYTFKHTHMALYVKLVRITSFSPPRLLLTSI